jgi:hypothetical protein
MKGVVADVVDRPRKLNAVSLQNAVLCADCDCVSDSPQDRCLVCGSRSLFNISRVLGGNLSKNRAALIDTQAMEPRKTEFVLTFPRLRKMPQRRQPVAPPDLPASSGGVAFHSERVGG